MLARSGVEPPPDGPSCLQGRKFRTAERMLACSGVGQTVQAQHVCLAVLWWPRGGRHGAKGGRRRETETSLGTMGAIYHTIQRCATSSLTALSSHNIDVSSTRRAPAPTASCNPVPRFSSRANRGLCLTFCIDSNSGSSPDAIVQRAKTEIREIFVDSWETSRQTRVWILRTRINGCGVSMSGSKQFC